MVVMKGKDALVKNLQVEGVEYIFGNPGTTESPIIHELTKCSNSGIEYILVLQEGVAIGIADAYSRLSNKPTFLNLHIETGLGNAVSLLHNVFETGTSMVLSAANKDIRELTHGMTDLTDVVKPFTKWSIEASMPEQIPFSIRRAFNEARKVPTGPTFISFTANALDHDAEMEILPPDEAPSYGYPDKDAIESAANILMQANNPIFLLGDKVGNLKAVSEVVRLSEISGSKVYAMEYSEMNFPTDHSQYFGKLRLGYKEDQSIISEADVIFVIGKITSGYFMFSNPSLRYFNEQSTLIHLDNDSNEIGKSQKTNIPILGDIKLSISNLNVAIQSLMSSKTQKIINQRISTLKAKKQELIKVWTNDLLSKWDCNPMSPERMMSEISKFVKEAPGTILINDAVSSQSALFGSINFNREKSILGGFGGAIGWGVGAGIGAKLANPESPVLAILGDGTAMMTVQGFWTASSYKIPVVYIICNNSSYRVLKINMEYYRQHILNQSDAVDSQIGADFPGGLDIASMASAMGVKSKRITDPSEIKDSIHWAFSLGEPVVLDIVIDNQY